MHKLILVSLLSITAVACNEGKGGDNCIANGSLAIVEESMSELSVKVSGNQLIVDNSKSRTLSESGRTTFLLDSGLSYSYANTNEEEEDVDNSITRVDFNSNIITTDGMVMRIVQKHGKKNSFSIVEEDLIRELNNIKNKMGSSDMKVCSIQSASVDMDYDEKTGRGFTKTEMVMRAQFSEKFLKDMEVVGQ